MLILIDILGVNDMQGYFVITASDSDNKLILMSAFMLLTLTVMLIIVSFPSPTHSVIPGLKHPFSANPSHYSLSFSSSGLTT